MVIGMIPIALAKGAAAEMNNGLAWVIIGGLISSLFLTLIVVPVVYAIFDSVRVRLGKDKKVDYNELMTADYDHKELVDGFNPDHTL
jgi:HAE1 family hydrophobic/amphiphilic exporter-1